MCVDVRIAPRRFPCREEVMPALTRAISPARNRPPTLRLLPNVTLQQEAVQSSCRGGGGWSRHAVAPWPTTAHEGLRIRGCPYSVWPTVSGPASGSESVSEVWGGPRTRGPGSWPPRRASGPSSERSCPVRARRREPHQNCTTVPPSVMTGGSAEPVRFSLTNSAARFDDSSVPVLSWQTVTVKPPSSVRTAK